MIIKMAGVFTPARRRAITLLAPASGALHGLPGLPGLAGFGLPPHHDRGPGGPNGRPRQAATPHNAWWRGPVAGIHPSWPEIFSTPLSMPPARGACFVAGRLTSPHPSGGLPMMCKVFAQIIKTQNLKKKKKII